MWNCVCFRKANVHMLYVPADSCLFATVHCPSLPVSAETESLSWYVCVYTYIYICVCVCVCVYVYVYTYIYISFLKFRCSVCLAVIILIFLFAAIICSLSYFFPQGNFLKLHQLIKSVTYLFILWVGFLLQKQQLLLKWNIFFFLNHLLFSYFLKLIFF